MSQHTPGPWTYCTGSHGDACICGLVYAGDGKGVVAAVTVDRCPVQDHGCNAPPTEAMKANTRLIAAAPELLAACIAMRATMYSPKSEESILADAAIAKAKGGIPA